MKKFEYKNKIYYLTSSGWIDRTGCIVDYSTNLQLNTAYKADNRLENLDFETIVSIVTDYENNSSYELAISTIEMYIGSIKDLEEKNALLTRLMSYYRRLNNPNKAIRIFTDNLYSLQFNCAALTSVAAAYLDVNDLSNAKVFMARAKKYARSKQDYSYVKAVRLRNERDS